MPLRRTTLAFLAGVGLLLGPFSQRAGAPGLSVPSSMHRAAVVSARVASTHGMPAWHGGRLAVVATGSLLVFHHAPGPTPGPAFAVASRNPWHQPIRFLVVGASREGAGRRWLKVLLGIGPNGAAGWVALNEVALRTSHDRVVVSLSRRLLWHMRDGRVLQRFSVGVGAPNTPTTPGRFFVWAKLSSDPHGPYGSYILGLSGFSEVLTEWPGGGRIAIHGTDDPGDAGHRVSHGCVRVYNPLMEQLRDVPMGTQVVIRA